MKIKSLLENEGQFFSSWQNNYWTCWAGFSLRILVAGERCNVTGKYFLIKGLHIWIEVVTGYWKFAGEFCIGNREFYNLLHLMNTLIEYFYTGHYFYNLFVCLFVLYTRGLLKVITCGSRKYPYLSLGRFFHLNPPWNFQFIFIPSLINFCWWDPHPLGIFNDLPWGGYGYFLKPHIYFFILLNLFQLVGMAPWTLLQFFFMRWHAVS